MSRPADSYPPSKAEIAAHRDLCAPLLVPAPKVKRRCTLCGDERESPASIALYCRHGGEWFLMVRVDEEDEPSSRVI